jgi:hypothetical protein
MFELGRYLERPGTGVVKILAGREPNKTQKQNTKEREGIEMAPPSPTGKRKIPVLEMAVVVIGFLAIMGYNRMTIARLARTIPNVNSQVVGEWKSINGPEHLVFREDKSVSLTVPESRPAGGSTEQASPETAGPPSVPGKYVLAQGGKIYVELMNGKKYTTTISPQSPDRFDLIDARTDGVSTYVRLKEPQPPQPKS